MICGMPTSPTHLLAATQLDRKLPGLREAVSRLSGAKPVGGWIRGVRRALGLSTVALGRRLGLAQQSIVQLEANEKTETITLSSLRRVASALDAELVYAIVPRKNLRETITQQALKIAAERISPVAQSMKLESQGLTDKELYERIEELARELERRPRDLWR
jgi:predicted DNA-binding mobile mystery protein A